MNPSVCASTYLPLINEAIHSMHRVYKAKPSDRTGLAISVPQSLEHWIVL